MRRVHPQRAKPPAQSANDKPSSGGVVHKSLNYDCKAWTTHSELHKRYTSENSNNTLEQAVSQARLTITNNATLTTTSTKKPFMFSASSITPKSQEQESGATKRRLSGNLPIASTNNRKKNNSAKGGTRGQDRGRIVISDEDDDDDDFELPEAEELFSDAISKKTRRVESSANTNKASDHTRFYQAQTNGKNPLRKHTSPDMIMDEQAAAKADTAEDDTWLMSDFQVDQDIDLFIPSPTSIHGQLSARNVAEPPHKIPPAVSTRSTVSQTQNTLNEIDRLFLDGSPTRSPSTRFQTPFEDRELNEQRSPTPYVGPTGIYPPYQGMDDPGVNEVVLFEDPQQDDQVKGTGVIVNDGQDVGHPVTDDDVKPESQDKRSIGPQEASNMKAVNEQASEPIEQTAEEPDPPRQTHTFTLPRTSSAFRERLKRKPFDAKVGRIARRDGSNDI
jgi:hypothetical protein